MPLSKLENYLSPLVTGSRVAILGFGREGQSTYRTLRSLFPGLRLAIVDQVRQLPPEAEKQIEGDGQLELWLGGDCLSKLSSFDLIFKSPGVSPFLLQVQEAISRGAKVTSQTDIFFALFGSQVVAVTGTKGKSTTSQVLTQVLTQAGKPVLFLGNIGAPAFESISQMTDETLVVYETSSHQCEGLRHSPHVGVFLNLFADHLDYYPSLEAYGQAKRQLFVSQKPSDYCLYNIQDPAVVNLVQNLPGKKLGFGLEPHPQASVYLEGDWLVTREGKLMPSEEIPLPGKHNLMNVMPAIIVALQLGISQAELRGYLKQVTPVTKRLETIGVVEGITFVDDALATIPEATIAALEALGSQVETLIVGGFDRGQDFTQLAATIAASSVKTLILFPTTGEKIARLVQAQGVPIALFPVKTMKEAVKTALTYTHVGKTVLLSTASASFGLFADYRDRSEQFYLALADEGLRIPTERK